MTPLGNLIHRLLDHSDHLVVETYLMAFVGYPGSVESATRDDILHSTLHYDVELSLRLHSLGVEFFDADGELIDTPDNWKAQELLGFESTYRAVSLQGILADIEQYERTPALWPWYGKRCDYCGEPIAMLKESKYWADCPACFVNPQARP